MVAHNTLKLAYNSDVHQHFHRYVQLLTSFDVLTEATDSAGFHVNWLRHCPWPDPYLRDELLCGRPIQTCLESNITYLFCVYKTCTAIYCYIAKITCFHTFSPLHVPMLREKNLCQCIAFRCTCVSFYCALQFYPRASNFSGSSGIF